MGYFLSPPHTSPTHQVYVLLSSVFFSKNVLDFWILDCCLHPTTHQVYVLLISNVTVGDAGLYTCEVNFNPVLRSFHQLKVIQNVFFVVKEYSSNLTWRCWAQSWSLQLYQGAQQSPPCPAPPCPAPPHPPRPHQARRPPRTRSTCGATPPGFNFN